MRNRRGEYQSIDNNMTMANESNINPRPSARGNGGSQTAGTSQRPYVNQVRAASYRLKIVEKISQYR